MKKLLITILLLIPSVSLAFQDGANWAYGTLTAAIAIDATSMTVTSGTYSSAFPTTNFSVVIFSSTCSNPSLCANREIVLVSSRTGTTFSITRAQEGTTAAVWAAGSKVWNVLTEARIDELQAGGSVTAASIVNVPAGNIAADDVQEALNELDTDKVDTTDVIGIAYGGTGQALVDPAANTLLGWDNTDNDIRFITLGAGLTYTAATDTLDVTGGVGTGDVLWDGGVNVPVDNEIVRYQSTTGKKIQANSGATLSDTGAINIPSGQTYNIDGSAHGHAGTEITFAATGTIAATDVETAIAEVATDAAVATSITSGQLNIARMPACSAQYQMLVCDASLEPQYTNVFPLESIPDTVYFTATDTTKRIILSPTSLSASTTLTLTTKDSSAYVIGEHGVLPASANPTVDATNEIAIDTDGANLTGDVSIRVYDGSATIGIARKLQDINVTVVKPQDIADAVRDKFIFWENDTGMTATITRIKCWSGTDDTTINVEEYDADGQNNATVDAVEIATNGTGIYYAEETTISGATIEATHLLAIDFDDTDDPDYVKCTVRYWLNGAVD